MNTKDISILIVTRNETIRRFLTASLSSDYTCVTARDAEEAMKQIRACFFNLVIADITITNASGLELCKLIQDTCPGRVVIGLSELDGIQYAIEAMRQGAFEYIAKPLDFSDVTMAVEHTLRYKSLISKPRSLEAHAHRTNSQSSDFFGISICDSSLPEARVNI